MLLQRLVFFLFRKVIAEFFLTMYGDRHAITLTEEADLGVHTGQIGVAVELLSSNLTYRYVSSGNEGLVILRHILHSGFVDPFWEVLEVSLMAFFFLDGRPFYFQALFNFTCQRLVLLQAFVFKMYGHGVSPVGWLWRLISVHASIYKKHHRDIAAMNI